MSVTIQTELLSLTTLTTVTTVVKLPKCKPSTPCLTCNCPPCILLCGGRASIGLLSKLSKSEQSVA